MTDRRKLLHEFLAAFPLETLADMSLEKYTDLGRSDSFCYWLEHRTYELGSIRGGSSFKFGIYKYNEKPKVAYVRCDDTYAWLTKCGSTAGEAYERVRADVVKIARHARRGELEAIDQMTVFGEVVKWKIAFLYSDEQMMPLYSRSLLREVATKLGMEEPMKKSIPDLQRFLLQKKGTADLFDFYDRLLQMTADFGNNELQPLGKKYWLYAPGENASKWDRCRQDGIACIGWDNLGDLKKYASMDEVKERMKEVYEKPDADFMNNGLAVWEFVRVMQPGDVVYAKSGINGIVGRGVVKSDYRYDESYEDCPNVRRVEWTHVGTWEAPHRSVTKTLTDITKYPTYVHAMEALFYENSMKEPPMVYTKEHFLSEVFMEASAYDRLTALLKRKKNVILQGAPGVGKTFTAKRLAYSLLGRKDEEQIEMVQFHQNFAYEDFIMGYKPTKEGGFALREGIFYRFCKKARSHPDKDYFFLIDEINRGNLSKIFGELLMLIENGYRGQSIKLAYTDEDFSVPENVYIIGMMNTADRSLAMMDYALRRRFSFFEMEPGFATDGFNQYRARLHDETFDKVIEAVRKLNLTIATDDSLGEGFCIGHSYFCNQTTFSKEWLRDVVSYDIAPMLKEYWFDDPEKSKAQTDLLMSLLK